MIQASIETLAASITHSREVSCPLSISGFAVLFQPRFLQDLLNPVPSSAQASEFSNAKLPVFLANLNIKAFYLSPSEDSNFLTMIPTGQCASLPA
ncbi:MAG: hypothetical protein FD135_5442 [Comamonadaceae bacterium]|nr:MAG: hypothetical protein FD135_5442 [Comamonadaceae bacterium]